jgi:hypothetical protein
METSMKSCGLHGTHPNAIVMPEVMRLDRCGATGVLNPDNFNGSGIPCQENRGYNGNDTVYGVDTADGVLIWNLKR